jgi:hypothetical protein
LFEAAGEQILDVGFRRHDEPWIKKEPAAWGRSRLGVSDVPAHLGLIFVNLVPLFSAWRAE